MAPFPWRLVTVDIDGTLTRVHGWSEIARAFGRTDEYESAHRRFLARDVGEDEHLRRLLALATGRTVTEVEAVLGRTPKLSGIREGIDALHSAGARVALLTHNPAYVVDYYRRTFGFDGGRGIPVPIDDGGVIGDPREVRADKTSELRHLLVEFGVGARQVAHVGDGWSDAEVFHRVGAGIALNSRLLEVNRAADRALETTEFREVVAALRELVPRR